MKPYSTFSLVLLLLFSITATAQTKYKFTNQTAYVNSNRSEFRGKSKDRKLHVEWKKDIWLSPTVQGIDSIATDGYLTIYDVFKGEQYNLMVTPTKKGLNYHFTKNGTVQPFDKNSNNWYQSFLSSILYPHFKARFHPRFYREFKELVGVRMGSKFPEFEKQDITGKLVNSTSIKNHVTVLNFWNTKCRPCIKEIPDLNRLMAKYNDPSHFKFIAFSTDSREKLERFFQRKKELGFHFQQIPNAEDVEEAINITYNPISFILGPQGEVLYMQVGYTSKNIREMDKILAFERKRVQAEY